MNKLTRLDDTLRLAMLAFAYTMMTRPPDVIIGAEDDPYVYRWWIGPHGKEPSAYIHKFLRSDNDRALHDHRYRNVSVILEGQCLEHVHSYPLIVEDGKYKTIAHPRSTGDVVERPAAMPHRIELIDGLPMTTIFYTGAHERDWGFVTPNGWVPWREFTDQSGTYGKTGI